MGKTVHNNSITVAKAIGIILMVMGHSGCPQVIFKFIYLFHMPLFFFCSGIFFNELNSHKTAIQFLKKRIKGLYLPFVKWSVLFLLLHNLLMSVGVYNTSYGYEGGSSYYTISEMAHKLTGILFTMHDYEELLGGFWFIRALFVSTILIVVFSLLLKSVSQYKYELLCVFFLVLTIFIRRLAPDPEFWRDISMGAFGAFFYMTGYILMRYKGCWQNKYGSILCCFFLFLSYFYFKTPVSMGCGYNKVFVFSVSAVSGTFLTICLSKLIEDKLSFLRRILYYIGNHTLEILALHFFAFRLANYGICLLYGLDLDHVAEHPVVRDASVATSPWWILYAVIGIVFPLLIHTVWLGVVNVLKEKMICR